jgi:hypothetical protein
MVKLLFDKLAADNPNQGIRITDNDLPHFLPAACFDSGLGVKGASPYRIPTRGNLITALDNLIRDIRDHAQGIVDQEIARHSLALFDAA